MKKDIYKSTNAQRRFYKIAAVFVVSLFQFLINLVIKEIITNPNPATSQSLETLAVINKKL
jgi:hypothetical protein